MLYEYDEEWVDQEDGRRRRRYNYPHRRKRRPRNDYAEDFFKKRRPKIKLYPGMPLKINEDKSRIANDLDHEIQELKTSLRDEEEEVDLDIDQLDQEYLKEIDLSIMDQGRDELKVVMKNNKLIKVIDLVQEEKRFELDIGKEKIKENLLAPDDILNPTKDEISHAISIIKSQFKHEDPFHIISKLYSEIILKKRPLNEFLHLFWTRQRDEELLTLFIKYMSFPRVAHTFSLDNDIKGESIVKRLRFLIKRAMVKYNQQVQVFKRSLTNLNKIGDGIVDLILHKQQKLVLEIQVLLCKLYLSTKIDRDFFYEVATKLNLLFNETLPAVRHFK